MTHWCLLALPVQWRMMARLRWAPRLQPALTRDLCDIMADSVLGPAASRNIYYWSSAVGGFHFDLVQRKSKSAVLCIVFGSWMFLSDTYCDKLCYNISVHSNDTLRLTENVHEIHVNMVSPAGPHSPIMLHSAVKHFCSLPPNETSNVKISARETKERDT